MRVLKDRVRWWQSGDPSDGEPKAIWIVGKDEDEIADIVAECWAAIGREKNLIDHALAHLGSYPNGHGTQRIYKSAFEAVGRHFLTYHGQKLLDAGN